MSIRKFLKCNHLHGPWMWGNADPLTANHNQASSRPGNDRLTQQCYKWWEKKDIKTIFDAFCTTIYAHVWWDLRVLHTPPMTQVFVFVEKDEDVTRVCVGYGRKLKKHLRMFAFPPMDYLLEFSLRGRRESQYSCFTSAEQLPKTKQKDRTSI